MLTNGTGDDMRADPPVPVARPPRGRLRLALIAVAGVIVAVCVALVGVVAVATVAQGDGAPDPHVAAMGVLLALGQWQDLSDANRYLCDDTADELRAKLSDLRHHLVTILESYAVVTGPSQVVMWRDDEATVATTMGVNWMPPRSDGMVYRGELLPWTFRTHREGFPTRGWKVCGFDAPQPCDYVKCR